MSAASAVLPRLLPISLPRIRFKRPRWPRGDRHALAMMLFNVVVVVVQLVLGVLLDNPAVGSVAAALNVPWIVFWLWRWIVSRRGGPGAT